MKLHILPNFRGEDQGDGGIRRVVEAQHRHLPPLGYTIVNSIAEADLVATHAGNTPEVPPDKPWVVHCHGAYWSEYQWAKWHHDLNSHVVEAMRRADAVTAPSKWVAHAIQRNLWVDPTVLYHGVDLEDWPYNPNRSKGYVLWNKSRPDPVCDPWPVVEMADRMVDEQFLTTYYPITAAPLPNVVELGVQPYTDAQTSLRDAGFYLCTTRETFGIGTLEAMASGVPVVGWNWGGQAEFIRHQVTGWLCSPGDIDGLMEGVNWVRANRDGVIQRARADVEARFQWKDRMVAYDELYRDQLERAHHQAQQPKVSIVIPCYNLGRYLPAAVHSVSAQTFQDWEAVIVDDASTDNSLEVARELASHDERIRVVANDTNLYLAGALNRGISEAGGRYIMPLDADNGLTPRTLEWLVHGLDTTRDTDIAYGAVQFITDDGSPDLSIGADGISGWPQEFSFGGQMMQRNQIPSTCLYRRRVWERTGGYRRRWRTSEDADFWTRAVSIGMKPKRITRAPTLIYRTRPGQMSAVESIPNYSGWFPWTRDKALVLPPAPVTPPEEINFGLSWHFPSYERARVAVIIPVGPGHEELVIDALDSVEAQSYRAWEVVVVNDTRHPLRVPHPWAKVVDATNANMHGPGAARNLGVLLSSAPLLVFLDADDFLQPNALKDMVDAWGKGKGVIYGQWWDDKGDGVIELYDPPVFSPGLLTRTGCIHAVTALYSRADFMAVQGFDQEISHWEDWDLQLKLASRGICGTKLETPLFTYRKQAGRRREDNWEQFEAGKQAILNKWSQIWDHPEVLVAGCSGCPGGGGVQYKPSPGRMQIMNNQAEGLVLLEYTGDKLGVQTYRPPGSGQGYRFAAGGTNRFSWVYPEHVDWFINRGAFRKAEVPETSAPVERLETPMTHQVAVSAKGMAPTPLDGVDAADVRWGDGPHPEGAVVLEPLATIIEEAPPMSDEVAEVLAPADDSGLVDGMVGLGVDPMHRETVLASQAGLIPTEIDAWTPSPLRKIIDDIDPETAALALSQEKQGRNRQEVIRVLTQRIQRG